MRQNVQPLPSTNFAFGVAETFTIVIVRAEDEDAYCIFVPEQYDRSGYTVGNFTSDEMFTAKIPDMDPIAILRAWRSYGH